jgi:hypothetical protein
LNTIYGETLKKVCCFFKTAWIHKIPASVFDSFLNFSDIYNIQPLFQMSFNLILFCLKIFLFQLS